MQVGSAALHGDTEQVVDIHAGRTPATIAIIPRTVPAYEMTEVTAPLVAAAALGQACVETGALARPSRAQPGRASGDAPPRSRTCGPVLSPITTARPVSFRTPRSSSRSF